MVTQKIQLSNIEIKLLFTLERQSKEVFTVKDAAKILEDTSKQVIWDTLSRLVKKHRIERIERGKYILIPAKAGLKAVWGVRATELLKSFSQEYYISFWSALAYWGITEQIVKTLYISILKRKKSIQYLDTRYEFVKLSKKHFFGYVERNGINVASVEKLILDCLKHPEYSGGLSEISKIFYDSEVKINWDNLLVYLKKFNVNAVERRLYFLLDYFNLKENVVYRYLSKRKFEGYRLLEPSRSKNTGKYNSKFGLRININPETLREEIL